MEKILVRKPRDKDQLSATSHGFQWLQDLHSKSNTESQ